MPIVMDDGRENKMATDGKRVSGEWNEDQRKDQAEVEKLLKGFLQALLDEQTDFKVQEQK